MADMNDLRREWDSQPEYPEQRMNEIAKLVRTRSGSMRSRLFARDMGETIASVIIIVVFGAYWFTAPNAVAKTGIGIAIAGALEIIVLLQIVQRRGREDFASVPLKEFLLSEVRLLNRQIALLRHVAWWYLLPLYTGACVFVMGIGLDVGGMMIVFALAFCLGYFVFCAYIWRLNQKARRNTLQPLRDALQQTYDGLSKLDSQTPSDSELVNALSDPALNDTCRRSVQFVRASKAQLLVIFLACMGGFLAGMLIQHYSGEPMRFEEWPLGGLMVAALFAVVSTCVRRTHKDE